MCSKRRNSPQWRLVDSGPCDAAYNMALDEAIAIAVRNGWAPPTLRLYGWNGPAVSIGSFQKIADVNLLYCASHNTPVVRRPTGGRGILHGEELTYSFSSPNDGPFAHGLLDTYRKISAALQSGLAMVGVQAAIKMERESGRNLMRSPLCFKSASYGEIKFERRKLTGSAQKRWPDCFLQQGSIPYSIDYEKLEKVFNIKGSNELKDKKDSVNSSLVFDMVGLRELAPDFSAEEFKQCIASAFEQTFAVTLEDSLPSPREAELARSLMSGKYLDRRWTEGESGHSGSCSSSERSRKA